MMTCIVAVRPRIDVHLAKLIVKSWRYQESVRFIDGTYYMEETVVRYLDATNRRHIELETAPQTSPLSFAYYKDG